MKLPTPIEKIAVRRAILRFYMGHPLTNRGYMSRRKKMNKEEEIKLEQAGYCQNFDPAQVCCIRCFENGEKKYKGCKK